MVHACLLSVHCKQMTKVSSYRMLLVGSSHSGQLQWREGCWGACIPPSGRISLQNQSQKSVRDFGLELGENGGEFPLISEIDLNIPLPFCDDVVECSALVMIKSKS